MRERMPIVARRFWGVRCAERIGANCRVNTLSDYCKSIIGVAECTVYLSYIYRISIVYLSYINRKNTVVVGVRSAGSRREVSGCLVLK